MAESRSSKASPGWSIGYAQCDITPKKGQTLMSGYGRERYASGALKPLRAQAVAMRDPSGKIALLITADVLGFDRLSVEYIRRTLATERGLDPQGVMMAASHTHWGPPTLYRVTLTVGPLDPWFVASFERKLIAMACEALDGLKSGSVSYGAIDTNVGHNRRVPVSDGSVTWGVNLDGHYDAHTPVLRLSRDSTADDVQDIVVVTHACHPTSSGGIDKFTPDYPGAMRDRIEKTLGPNTRAVFAMGCGADAKVTHEDATSGDFIFTGDPKNSAAAGRKLASDVLTHLKNDAADRVSISASLNCRIASGSLTMGKPRTREQLEATAFQRDNANFEVWWSRQMLAYPDTRRKHYYEAQAWVLGDTLTLIGLEGEVCSPLGPLSRSLVKTPHAMTVAYANEVQGYIPSKSIVKEGGYEGESSHRAYFKPAPFTQRVEAEFQSIVEASLG